MGEYQHPIRQIGEKDTHGLTPPVGRLIAYENRVYRVADALPGSGEIFLQPADDPNGEVRRFYSDGRQSWRVLPEHYAVCARCGEPMPCRELREQWKANWALKKARELMSIPEGACWYCRKPISSRQRSVTFPGDNLKLPGGPAVTFHIGITDCRRGALNYQEKWVKAESGREPFLSWQDPYTGKPNQTQRRLLAMAARGELRCYVQRVRIAGPGDDVLAMIADREPPDPSELRWVPKSLPRNADQYVRPLIDAGLLAEPVMQHLGYQVSHYTLTDEGWATHRRYPETGTA